MTAADGGTDEEQQWVSNDALLGLAGNAIGVPTFGAIFMTALRYTDFTSASGPPGPNNNVDNDGISLFANASDHPKDEKEEEEEDQCDVIGCAANADLNPSRLNTLPQVFGEGNNRKKRTINKTNS